MGIIKAIKWLIYSKIEDILNTKNVIIQNKIEDNKIYKSNAIIEVDEYFIQSGMFFIEAGEAGLGKLQRHFSIGFNRAGRIMDQLQESGVIGHAESGESRKILMTKEQFEEYLMNVGITIKENSIPKQEVNNEEERIHMYSDKFDYMTGEDFEEFIANILKKIDFYNIQLTKKSGDQGVDILAEKQGIKHAIQCKRYSKAVGNSAVQQVFSGKVFYHCDVAVVVTNNYFTDSAIELARENGVILWDRNVLKELLDISEEENIENLFSENIDVSEDEVRGFAIKILDSFRVYGIYLTIEQCFIDRSYTKFCFIPESGIRIKKILSFKDDVSFVLGVPINMSVNYEKGVIEVEIHNKTIKEIMNKEDT